MSKIPTAEKFLDNIEISDGVFVHSTKAKKAMIEFAKIHVKQALKTASKKYWETATQGSNSIQGYHNDILNAYPLENIK